MIREAIAKACSEALDDSEMEGAMEAILSGEATPAQIAALAIALRMRGETAQELTAAARVLRRRMSPVSIGEGDLLDTCGTGGDGAGTFNISTASAIVIAACGVRVAKHGNRAVSSKSGSADVLEALGVRIDADPETSMRELSIAFFFAPQFHGALKHAAPVRRELGVRTFFNLLGPLANPARATHQLLGVYEAGRVRQMAEVLRALGARGAWVVHGECGLDEVSPCGATRVAILREGAIEERVVQPRDFGIEPVALQEIAGGDAAHNAQMIERVLRGDRGAPRSAVVINAAAALCAIEGHEPREAAARVEEAIDTGRALALLQRWIAWSAR